MLKMKAFRIQFRIRETTRKTNILIHFKGCLSNKGSAIKGWQLPVLGRVVSPRWGGCNPGSSGSDSTANICPGSGSFWLVSACTWKWGNILTLGGTKWKLLRRNFRASLQLFRALSLGKKKKTNKTQPKPKPKTKLLCVWIPLLKFYLVLISSSNREL